MKRVLLEVIPFAELFGVVVGIIKTFRLISTERVSGIVALAFGVWQATLASLLAFLVIVSVVSLYHQLSRAEK